MAGAYGLEQLKALAEQFAASQLNAYVARVRDEGGTTHPKEVNDALWGTIGLRPAEVIVLDSPLLQRLRYVRQLGVVHWVYPGAIHTRFEHSLGVLHQVRNIVAALNNAAEVSIGYEGSLIDQNQERLLRLCALIHDVGHAAFSHVSEMAVESLPELTPLFAQFSKEEKVEKRQLSEVIAYYVVRSESMRAFIELLQDRHQLGLEFSTDRATNIKEIVHRLSSAIIGKKIDDQIPLLHELISGPFDADKLDYFVRDAKLAGTPTLVDISRLVQKLTVRAFSSTDLPGEIAKHVEVKDRYYLFGVKWSGVAVLDELHLARVLLYAKIYRHPKVIAIEQMLRAFILAIAKIAPHQSVLEFLYRYPDDVLLWMDRPAIVTALGLDGTTLTAEEGSLLEAAVQTLKSVRERRLWLRAFQISSRYAADPLLVAQKNKLIEFIETVEHPQGRVEFLGTLLDEVKVIYDRLHPASPIDRSALESKVMLHAMGTTPGGTQIARAYLLPSTGDPVLFREYDVNRAAWADSYMSSQGKGYIFAAPELADVVYLAVEKILRLEYEIRLPPSAMEAGKRNASKLEGLKRELMQLGYYRSTPVDTRPMPARLQRADVEGIVRKFDKMRAGFLAPTVPAAPGAAATTSDEQTMLWLRQFDDEDHVECALKLLQKYRILTRSDTITAITTFIDQNPKFKGATVVPLGDIKDSGSVHTYFSGDLIGSYIGGVASLEQARTSAPQGPLIFIDDFMGSGGQAQDMLGAWFGHEALRKDLGESREMFGDGVREYLKGCPIAFVFVAAWDAGMESLRKALAEVELDAVRYRYLDESSLPFLDEALQGLDADRVTSFKARCEEIGRDLIRSTMEAEKAIVDETKIAERTMGYGNRGMLLATPFNVPTQSLTAIWLTGVTSSISWQPLLNRRKKQ